MAISLGSSSSSSIPIGIAASSNINDTAAILTWGNMDGTISHNYDYDTLWECIYYAIINKETDEVMRNTYKALLQLNKNDYRNTVLQIELEKNESLPSN
ncbi:MAG: hypothetical protein IJ880_11265 [Bacilli bacterium]|nr:hypothetical protein [Bacilli bacterium]